MDRVSVANRSLERARNMARRIGGARTRVLDGPEPWRDGDFDLVVNATSVGLHDECTPLDLEDVRRVGGLLDLVYGPDATPLVRQARRLGIPAADGREMLVQQAAASFQRWWDREAPVEAMREALEAAEASP